ncbi:hypothetical protein [Microbacterium sp. NIBRBAC000506063]|uniref:hypothetical protein n=1 Tax=Microbacterium sp. NIBRBAC000506063 TaxID=2734618 RepID=UPI003980441C
MLDENLVFEDRDLGAAVLGAHDHLAVDRLAAGEELRLGDDRAATTRIAPVAAALALGLQAGGALDPLRLGDVLDDTLALARLALLLSAAVLGPPRRRRPPRRPEDEPLSSSSGSRPDAPGAG